MTDNGFRDGQGEGQPEQSGENRGPYGRPADGGGPQGGRGYDNRPPRRDYRPGGGSRTYENLGPRRDFTPNREGGRDFNNRSPRREYTPNREGNGPMDSHPPRRDFTPNREGGRDFNNRPPRREYTPNREGNRPFDSRPPRSEFTPNRDRPGFGARPPRPQGGLQDAPRGPYGRPAPDANSAQTAGAPPQGPAGERGFVARPPRPAYAPDRPDFRRFDSRPPRRYFSPNRTDNREFGDRPPRRDFTPDWPDNRSYDNRPPRQDFAPRREFSPNRPDNRDSGNRPPRHDFTPNRPDNRNFDNRPPRREFTPRPDNRFQDRLQGQFGRPTPGGFRRSFGPDSGNSGPQPFAPARPDAPKPFAPREPGAFAPRPFTPRSPDGPRMFTPNRPFTPRPDSAPAQTRTQMGARQAALQVLNRVLVDEAYAQLSLDEMFQTTSLTPQDRRLATRLVYTTLENLTRIDFALSPFLHDAEALDPRVRNVLRLSATQMLLLDRVPDFAAVNEAVDLVRGLGLEELTGLTNGVLRSLARGREGIAWPRPGDENYLAVTYSVPAWLGETVVADYGQQVGEAILAYSNPDRPITIRRNEVLTTEDEFRKILEAKVWTARPGIIPEAVLVSGAPDIGRDADFLAGKFSIHSEGSMACVLAVDVKPGMNVLDACAAPGGKTAMMAERMQNTGRVHAWDLHEHRVALIQAQADRLRLYNVRPAMRDATEYREQFEEVMDAVLLDAPCSGTGVMDNKPDIKQRITREGVAALVKLQEDLLEAVCRNVKPGAALVYTTCSVLKDENERQIERFLTRHPEFTLADLPESIPEALRAQAGSTGLQLLPHRDRVEGFYIARMIRKP